MTMTSQLPDMTSSSIFFDVALFHLSSLVTGPSIMSISLVVMELRQFSFIRDWAEILKSEIPLSKFCPISGHWSKSGMPSLTQRSLIKFYWMLQNARVNSFYSFWVINGKQTGSKITHFLTQSRVKLLRNKN